MAGTLGQTTEQQRLATAKPKFSVNQFLNAWFVLGASLLIRLSLTLPATARGETEKFDVEIVIAVDEISKQLLHELLLTDLTIAFLIHRVPNIYEIIQQYATKT